jgi:hypothetical protein
MDKMKQKEWDRSVGYGLVPDDKKIPEFEKQHWNGEQQLNKVTGQVEVWYNGGWCVSRR